MAKTFLEKAKTFGMTTIALGILGGLGALYALTNVYVIKDTEVGVRVKLGEIQPEPVKTGLAFTMPFVEDIRIVPTTEQKIDFNGLTLTTKADAASPATGNLIIKYRIKGDKAPQILKDYGTVDNYEDLSIKQPVLGEARVLAASFEDTRTLMLPQSRELLANDLKKYIESISTGIEIPDNGIEVKDILPHKTIAERIDRAAQRIEDDTIEQHNLKLAQTAAKTKEAEAEGEEFKRMSAARAKAFETTSQSEAEAAARKNEADALRYTLEQQAAGNASLNKTLTPEILKMKELEVRLAEAGKGWDGKLPDNFAPVYGGDSSQSAPFILKTLK